MGLKIRTLVETRGLRLQRQVVTDIYLTITWVVILKGIAWAEIMSVPLILPGTAAWQYHNQPCHPGPQPSLAQLPYVRGNKSWKWLAGCHTEAYRLSLKHPQHWPLSHDSLGTKQQILLFIRISHPMVQVLSLPKFEGNLQEGHKPHLEICWTLSSMLPTIKCYRKLGKCFKTNGVNFASLRCFWQQHHQNSLKVIGCMMMVQNIYMYPTITWYFVRNVGCTIANEDTSCFIQTAKIRSCF